MTDDNDLIAQIRTTWTPDRPGPDAFEAGLQRRLARARSRRAVGVTAVAAATAMGALLLTWPVSMTSPVGGASVDLPASASFAELNRPLPDEYAALSMLFLTPVASEEP